MEFRRIRIPSLHATYPTGAIPLRRKRDCSFSKRPISLRRGREHIQAAALRNRFAKELRVRGQPSLAFKATIDDPHRFKSSKTVPAHLGLTPRIYQSGEIERSGHISKSGDRLMRYLLAEAASSMLLRSRKWCSLKAWGIRLAKKVGMGKAVVAVARKLAIVMHRMWLTGEPFQFGVSDASPWTP